jgi:hypothetical protein
MQKKFKLIGLLILFVFSLSGCNVPFTEKVFYLPMIEKKPDEVLALMFKNMLSIKKASYRSESDFDINIDPKKLSAKKQDEINKLAGLIISSGPVVLGIDMEDLDVPAFPFFMSGNDFINSEAANLNIKVKTEGQFDNTDEGDRKAKSSNHLNGLLGGIEADFVLETIAADNKHYARIDRAPSLFDPYVNGLSDKWIVFDLADPKGEPNKDIAGLPDQFVFADILEKKHNIFEAFLRSGKEKDLFLENKRLSDQKVNGRNTYHYLLNVNKQIILPALYEFFPSDLEEGGLDPLIKEMEREKRIQKIVNAIGEFKIEAWIDKKDFHLLKYVLNIEFNGQNNLDDQFGALSFKSRVTAEHNFNEVSPIETPASAYKFNEAMNEFVLTPMKEAGMPARDRKRAADAESIIAFLQEYYNEWGIYPRDLYYAYEEYFADEEEQNYFPLNPRPNDGDCGSEYEYKYLSRNSGTAYEFEFCLGSKIGENNAGINRIISESIDLPSITKSIKYDMDGDGLSDYEESKYNTAPRNADTDSDGLWDYEEIFIYFTDPLNQDTDGDGYNDGEEAANWFDPGKKLAVLEPYGSGHALIRKAYESIYAGDPEIYISKIDINKDLSDFAAKEFNLNIEEFLAILKKASSPRGRRLESINFTLAEKIDDQNYRYEFVETYLPFDNGYMPRPLKQGAHVKNVQGIWLFDILSDLKSLKNEGVSWPVVLQIFAK